MDGAESESEAEAGAEVPVVAAVVENGAAEQAPSSLHARQVRMAMRRRYARTKMQQSVEKLHEILVGQRLLFEEAQPRYAAPSVAAKSKEPSAVDGCCGAASVVAAAADAGNEELRLAQLKATEMIDSLAVQLRRVREVRKKLAPHSLEAPAVVAFSVSAPGTSWGADEWIQTPVPFFADALKKLFLAAYSNERTTQNKVNTHAPHPSRKRKTEPQDGAQPP